jgi:hypothetical protein
MEINQITDQIKTLPPAMLQQVGDFVLFLKSKNEPYNNTSKNTMREFGYAKGKIKISDDFKYTPEEFKDYL